MLDQYDIDIFNASYIPEPMSGCWLWLGGSGDSRGCISIDGEKWTAPRLSYTIHRGPIPDGLLVRHTCDNPPCVNPDHLRLGTDRDNAVDKMPSDYQPVVLSSQHVLCIRRLMAAGFTQVAAARVFRVSQKTVSHIKTRHTWRHI